MYKGISTMLEVMIVLFVALVILGIFFLYPQHIEEGESHYSNVSNRTGLPGINLSVSQFRPEGRIYCANSIPGMLEKSDCGCSSDNCEDDDFSFEYDGHCKSAPGSYLDWDKNAVCIKGDGCCSRQNSTGNLLGQCLEVKIEEVIGESVNLKLFNFRIDTNPSDSCVNDIDIYAEYGGISERKLVKNNINGKGPIIVNLDSSDFVGEVSKIEICSDTTGDDGEYCSHKIDWVEFATHEKIGCSFMPCEDDEDCPSFCGCASDGYCHMCNRYCEVSWKSVCGDGSAQKCVSAEKHPGVKVYDCVDEGDLIPNILCDGNCKNQWDCFLNCDECGNIFDNPNPTL